MTYYPEILFFGNSIKDYLKALILLIILIAGTKFVLPFIFVKLQKVVENLPTDIDNFLLESLKKISTFSYWMISIYLASRSLIIIPWVDKLLYYLLMLVFTWEIIRFLNRAVYFFTQKHLDKSSSLHKASQKMGVNALRIISNVLIWAIGILLLLSNLGYNINALIASLGIGGVAIALALQNILGDLFSSISLFFDKPFQIGDYISISGKDSGTVEEIGLKSTKLRTTNGQLLIVPNSDLIKSRLQNFHKMSKRRVDIQLMVTYETKSELLEIIPSLTQKIVEKFDNTKFSRCYFKDYGDSGLIFEMTYYINKRDYLLYIKIKHQINLDIKKTFEKEKIDFAYPTQTIYFKK